VVSPARRAQQTLARVVAVTGPLDQCEDERIYEATPGTLIDVIESHRDVERLMLVGHNPGFESLAALLSTGQSGDHRGMPPGGVAILTFTETAVLEPGAAELTAFWAP
jgi:phosphohistidine phosphatase